MTPGANTRVPPGGARDAFSLVVHTLFLRGAQVLLLRRVDTGFMDGHYTLPGGHRQHRETIVDAAVRECREEVGVGVRSIRPVAVLPYAGGANFIFEALAWEGAPCVAEPTQCDVVTFAPSDALPTPVAPFVHTALRCRREQRWYHEREPEAAVALR